MYVWRSILQTKYCVCKVSQFWKGQQSISFYRSPSPGQKLITDAEQNFNRLLKADCKANCHEMRICFIIQGCILLMQHITPCGCCFPISFFFCCEVLVCLFYSLDISPYDRQYIWFLKEGPEKSAPSTIKWCMMLWKKNSCIKLYSSSGKKTLVTYWDR